MVTEQQPYAARLDIDFPESLDRFTTFFRLIWVISIMIVLSALSAVAQLRTDPHSASHHPGPR